MVLDWDVVGTLALVAVASVGGTWKLTRDLKSDQDATAQKQTKALEAHAAASAEAAKLQSQAMQQHVSTLGEVSTGLQTLAATFGEHSKRVEGELAHVRTAIVDVERRQERVNERFNSEIRELRRA